MPTVPYRPERILVQAEARDDCLTRRILERLPGIPASTVKSAEAVLPELSQGSDPITSGKRTLILTRYRGRFVERCPGAGADICCNYFVLNFASNCPLECTYCVLQSYLNNPSIMVYTNVEDMTAEVEDMLRCSPGQILRIGTGEMADSLAMDPITGISRLLVPFFASLSNGILELKTKSDEVANLEGLDHRGHTVVSWSVNSKRICRTEELKAASLEERLAAARRCQEWGYKVGFHFDPLVHYEGWEDEYREAVEQIFGSVDCSRLAWVSLGCLRFTPHLRDIIRERFWRSKIPYGEFVPGHHGKLRYFRPIREEMYGKMREWIQQMAPRVLTYLCMESRVTWERSFGYAPRDTSDLSARLDSCAAG